MPLPLCFALECKLVQLNRCQHGHINSWGESKPNNSVSAHHRHSWKLVSVCPASCSIAKLQSNKQWDLFQIQQIRWIEGESTNKIDQFWENNTTINKTKIYLVIVPTCHCLKQSRSLLDVMFVELSWKSKASCQNQWLWSTTASNPIPANFSFIFWTDHCNINIQRSWLSGYATNLFLIMILLLSDIMGFLQ